MKNNTENLYELIVDILRDMVQIIFDWITRFTNMILDNLDLVANLIYIALPFIMLKIGNYMHQERGVVEFRGEIIIPLLFFFIIQLLKELHKRRRNIKTDIPVPSKRFTMVDGHKVEVEQVRLEEMLLYLQELEDYFESKGYFLFRDDNDSEEES